VNAKILYCHPPPGVSEASFNKRTHELALLRAVNKKRAPVTRVGKGANTFVLLNVPVVPSADSVTPALGQGHKSKTVDQAFFTNDSSLASRPFVQGSARHGQEFSRTQLFPHQNAVANDGSALSGRRARIAAVINSQAVDIGAGKKHFKKNKRVKQRSGKGYDV
jgi:large subunit GTPase 1